MSEREEVSKDWSTAMNNISIVLVEPRGPANIGATARAISNCGLHDLVLVNPCEYHNDECFGRACNSGEVVLNARVFPTLSECVSEFAFVMGTTRRTGKLREPLTDLPGAVRMIKGMSESNSVAILFGREDRGLVNTELALCDALVELPAHEDYPSLNLSHAVFLLCHYLYMDTGEREPFRAITAAPREERDKMYVHLEEMLRALDYGDEGREFLLRAIMKNFRVLFGRTSLMEKEVNMLRGLFAQILVRLGR
ncbi:MAG: RNA methyltransferase [Thermodesulfobacteriota bacterium]